MKTERTQNGTDNVKGGKKRLVQFIQEKEWKPSNRNYGDGGFGKIDVDVNHVNINVENINERINRKRNVLVGSGYGKRFNKFEVLGNSSKADRDYQNRMQTTGIDSKTNLGFDLAQAEFDFGMNKELMAL